MGKDNVRSTCSVNNSRGSYASVHYSSASISCTTVSVSGFRSSQGISSFSRDRHSSSEVSHRGGISVNPDSRVLFPSFSSTQEIGGNETGIRPFHFEQPPCHTSVQNGNQQVYQSGHPSWYLDHFFRPTGCVFPCSYRPVLQEISSFSLERQSFPIQGSPFWPFHSPFGVYQNHASSCGLSSFSSHSDSFLSGRFSHQESLPYSFGFSDFGGDRVFPIPRVSDLMEKVRNPSNPRLCVSGRTLPYQSRSGSSSRGEVSQFNQSDSEIPFFQVSVCSSVPSVAWFPEFSSRCSSSGSSSYTPHSVLSTQLLDSIIPRMGSSDSYFTSSVSTSSVVVSSTECSKGPFAIPFSSFDNSVHRCLHPRLGSISGSTGSFNLRNLGSSSSIRAYKHSGNESSSSCSQPLSDEVRKSIGTSGLRQLYSCSLSEKSRRYPFSSSISVGQGCASFLSEISCSSVSPTYSQQGKSLSRHSISSSGSCQHRMGITPICVPEYNLTVGHSAHRSLCDKSQSQDSDFCISGARSESICSRCNESLLGESICLCFSSLPLSGPSSSEDRGLGLSDHTYCSGMAETGLVLRSSSSVMCQPSSSSQTGRSVVTAQRKGSSSQSREPTSSRLVSVRNNLTKRGFSESAARHLSRSVRESTNIVYDAKWTIFSHWCSQQEIDPFQVSIQQLADFLVFLFEDKKLAPSTIKGYRSAISKTISLSGGQDFSTNDFLSLLVRNFSLERPRQRVLVPQWDMSLILHSLKLSPFEPANEVPIKFLAYKCCFLLALASGRRRSEIHAFSVAPSCLRFSSDKSSVTLLTDPSFLAKNQIPDRGSAPVIIPALPRDADDLLCPVRILEIYLRKTSSLRSVNNNRLFLPIKKGITDLSVKTISSWIVKTISLCYDSSKEDMRKLYQVKAHDVRAISTSWALFNSASLDEVLSAGFWRTENSFISHYLKSMSSSAEGLYSLGPIVSAQRVIIPPDSSDSGVSAMR